MKETLQIDHHQIDSLADESTGSVISFPFRWRWCLLLLLITFIPRGLMAIRADVICPDATLYIELAQALERGDYKTGFRELNLNTFPLALMTLHRLGLDWESAGKIWSLTVSTLVVLPLFGWLRRQFNESVAWVGCCLYAGHGMLIQWSPELIRDPTFWLLTTLTLYLQWRAAEQLKLIWYALAGLSLILACLTRVEGLLLIIPLLFWSFRARQSLQVWRPLLGVSLCLSIAPILLVTANLFWLDDFSPWNSIRTVPLSIAMQWSNSSLNISSDNSSTRPLDADPAVLSLWKRTVILFDSLQRGLRPLFAIMVLFGIWIHRHLWRRSEHQALFLIALAVIFGMWICLWYANVSSSRYPLLIAVIAVPWAALALLNAASWLAQDCKWTPLFLKNKSVSLAMLLTLFFLIGTTEALSRRHNQRRAQAEIGRTILQEYGHGTKILGFEELEKLVAYYSQGTYQSVNASFDAETFIKKIDHFKPDVVLLSSTTLTEIISYKTKQSLRDLGWQEFQLPDSAQKITGVTALAQIDDSSRISKSPENTKSATRDHLPKKNRH